MDPGRRGRRPKEPWKFHEDFPLTSCLVYVVAASAALAVVWLLAALAMGGG